MQPWIKLFVETAFGFISSFGFGLLTNIPRRALIPAGLTGAASWLAYCIFGLYSQHIVWQNLIATIVIDYLGNVFAQKYQTPVTMIYIPSLVSLVPGGMAAMGMKNLTLGSHQAGSEIISVLLIATALAVGFIVGEILFKLTFPKR